MFVVSVTIHANYFMYDAVEVNLYGFFLCIMWFCGTGSLRHGDDLLRGFTLCHLVVGGDYKVVELSAADVWRSY